MNNFFARLGIIGELLQFLWERKLYWLIPMILVLIIFGTLIVFGSNPVHRTVHLHAFLAMTTAIIFGIAFGLVAGFFVQRSSQNRDPIYGGVTAQALHYIGASTVSAMPVTVLGVIIATHDLGVFLVRLGYALLTALSLGVVMYGSMYIFAMVERPAREQALRQKAELGWTEEDARTSGL